ncbi:MAG: zinc ribbon domain-containing protein [Deinococcus sp.]|nr:zinc ribbon domain-containing protein [Deinococcus sp.]
MGDGLVECPNCGIRNRAGARHCRSCGITLEAASAPARAPVEPALEPPADVPYSPGYAEDYAAYPESGGYESYFALRLGSVMAKMGAVVLLVVGWGLLALSRLPVRSSIPAALVSLSLPMVLLYAVAVGVASCLVWAIGDALRVVLKIAQRVR